MNDWAAPMGPQVARTGLDPEPRIFREVDEWLRESGRGHAADELEAAIEELRGRPAPDYDPRVDHPERYRDGPV